MMTYPGLEKRFQDLHRAEAMRQAERWRLWRLCHTPVALASARRPTLGTSGRADAEDTPAARARATLLQAASSLWELLLPLRN